MDSSRGFTLLVPLSTPPSSISILFSLRLAPELEGNLLDRSRFREVEDDVPAEERRLDVDACAAEDECVRVDRDVYRRVAAFGLLAEHLVSLWCPGWVGRLGAVVGVGLQTGGGREGLKSSMKGGRKGIFFCVTGRG